MTEVVTVVSMHIITLDHSGLLDFQAYLPGLAMAFCFPHWIWTVPHDTTMTDASRGSPGRASNSLPAIFLTFMRYVLFCFVLFRLHHRVKIM